MTGQDRGGWTDSAAGVTVNARWRWLCFVQVDRDPEGGWTGLTGYVTPALIEEKLPGPSPENIIFVCGPPGMMKVRVSYPRGM